jgi:hypothetical protein
VWHGGDGVLRVVSLRRGAIRPGEFKLREGEKGLSLFALVSHPEPAAIREAVRSAGKHGDLGVAVVPAAELVKLGLVLVRTPGGTPSEEVNRLHYEARLPWLRRLWLRVRFRPLTPYFNDQMSPRIGACARLLEGETR